MLWGRNRESFYQVGEAVKLHLLEETILFTSTSWLLLQIYLCSFIACRTGEYTEYCQQIKQNTNLKQKEVLYLPDVTDVFQAS